MEWEWRKVEYAEDDVQIGIEIVDYQLSMRVLVGTFI